MLMCSIKHINRFSQRFSDSGLGKLSSLHIEHAFSLKTQENTFLVFGSENTVLCFFPMNFLIIFHIGSKNFTAKSSSPIQQSTLLKSHHFEIQLILIKLLILFYLISHSVHCLRLSGQELHVHGTVLCKLAATSTESTNNNCK